jgi:cytochrome P450
VTLTSDRPVEPAPLVFDVYDHDLQDDPYPIYRRLRDEAPLHHNSQFDYWVLSRHEDVHWALRNDELFSNAMGVTLDESAWSPHAHKVMSFLAMDAPEATRLRRLVSKGFTPRRVAELEPRVRQLAEQYFEGLLGGGGEVSFNWIQDFAGRLPMDVISELVGVPEADRDEVRRLADLLVSRQDGLRDVPPAGMRASMELFDYYAGMIAERRRQPSDDLTSALLNAEDEGQRMTDEEITAFLFLMVVAGNETTTKLLGNALFHLSKDPDQVASAFADGDDVSHVDPWIEETLRHDTSTQFLARHLRADLTRHGVTAPAGSKIVIALGAANHDDRVFSRPESFDIRRDASELSQIVSFGGGRHFCLGANLARLEARIALSELVRRAERLEVHDDQAVRFYSANVRGFASLPVTVRVR